MKITKTQLKQIIKEELESVLQERSFMQKAASVGKGIARTATLGQLGGCPDMVRHQGQDAYMEPPAEVGAELGKDGTVTVKDAVAIEMKNLSGQSRRRRGAAALRLASLWRKFPGCMRNIQKENPDVLNIEQLRNY